MNLKIFAVEFEPGKPVVSRSRMDLARSPPKHERTRRAVNAAKHRDDAQLSDGPKTKPKNLGFISFFFDHSHEPILADP